MHKHMIYRMLILLTACITVVFFSACGSDDQTGKGIVAEVPAETPEEEGSPSFAGMDFSKYKDTVFHIAGPSSSGWTYSDVFLYAENYDGTTVNDAVYERNKRVEDRFSITIEFFCDDDVANDVRKLIMTDDCPYDVVFMPGTKVTSFVQSGYLEDLNTLKYCDFTKNYWDQNCYNTLSLGGKIYYMVGDISAAMLSGSEVAFFNKNMISEFKLDNPYELVYSNKWTWEKMFEMGRAVSADLNNDGKWNEHDRYGMFYFRVPMALQASGIRFTENNSEGIPEVVFLQKDANRTVAAYNLFCDAINEKGLNLSPNGLSTEADISAYLHKLDYCRGELFGGDQVLFCLSGLLTSDLLTNMESDYGIVPFPKYDAEQQEYHSTVDYGFSFMTVPVTNQRLDFTSCVLEYMAYASGDSVIHAYYDKVMKGQRASDPDCIEMLDIIKDSLTYEFAQINDVGIYSTIENSISKKTLTSSFASNEKAIQRRLQNIIDQFS